jgi:cbb3-type cytochrome oxidase subunit 1
MLGQQLDLTTLENWLWEAALVTAVRQLPAGYTQPSLREIPSL